MMMTKTLETTDFGRYGSVILTAGGIVSGSNKPPAKPNKAEESEWQAFINQLDWDRSPNRLWIQYTVLG